MYAALQSRDIPASSRGNFIFGTTLAVEISALRLYQRGFRKLICCVPDTQNSFHFRPSLDMKTIVLIIFRITLGYIPCS